MSGRGRSLPAVRRDVACGLIALLLGLLAVTMSVAPFGGHLSALVRMARTDPVAELVSTNPDWAYVESHYDGIYFYAMALDPLAAGRPHELIDFGAYRYGHPAYGWLAGLLALFDPRLIPVTLVVISLVGLFLAGFIGSRVATILGLSSWAGVAIALNPGLIYAAANDTSEAFGSALMLAVLWAWLSGRHRTAGLLILPLCFAKEHLLLVPIGLAMWETALLWRGGSRSEWGRRMLWLAPGPILYAMWQVYVHGQFGVWSFTQGDNLALPVPLVGWIDSLLRSARLAAGPFSEMQIGEGALPLQIAALGALLIGAIRAIRIRSPLDPVYLLVALLMSYMSWKQVLYPKDLLRCLAFALVLVPLIVPSPARLGLAAVPQPRAGAGKRTTVPPGSPAAD